MDSIDDLLAKMQSDFTEKCNNEKNIPSRDRARESGEIDGLLAELQGTFQNRSKTNQTPTMSPKPDQPSTDDLLAQMQAEFGEKPQPQPPKKSAIDDLLSDVAGEFTEKTAEQTTVRSPQIDEMLSEVRGEFGHKKETRRSRKPQVSANTDRFLLDLKADFQQKQVIHSPASSSKTDPKTDDLLADLKSEFHQKLDDPPRSPLNNGGDRVEERLRRHEQELREQREREWARKQRRKALQSKAEKWLKQLDPYSGEGLWFSEFAEHYPNKIEAAIDYLETVWETQK